MEIILLEKVRNLGNLGDQVRVRSGYGRNFLIPQGKAVIANEKNKAQFEARRAELEKVQAVALNAAKARAEKMAGATVQILGKAGEEGKLFGSIGTADIAEAMTNAGFPLERAEIHLPSGPIKQIGDFEIPVSLHTEVNFKIIVSVVAEKAEK
jgi:large subunit ribosomal protein L9